MKHTVLFLWLIMSCTLPAIAGNRIKAVLFPFRETVLSARVESTLTTYKFRIGEVFPQGAVLTELNSLVYTLKFKQRNSQLKFSGEVYRDKKELRANNYTSDLELNKAEFEFKMAELACEEARFDLDSCKITAPFSGKIAEILTKEYENVRPGQQICRIIDDHTLLAVMNVPQKQLPAPGATVCIILDDSLEKVYGKVYEISPQADHRTGTVRIRVVIDNSKGTLRAGSTGELFYGK